MATDQLAKEYSDARSAVKRDQILRDDAIRTLLSTVPGRKLLWWLFEQCHILQQDFSPDHALMSFSCGERNIGLRLWAEVQRISPQQLLQSIMENTKDKELRNDDAERTHSASNGDEPGSDGVE